MTAEAVAGDAPASAGGASAGGASAGGAGVGVQGGAGRRRRRVAGLALLAALLAGGGGAAAQSADAPGHSYRAVAGAVPSPEAGALAASLGGTAAVADLVAPGEARPLARAELAVLPDGGRQILGWRSLGRDPLLRRDSRAAEEEKLVAALTRHLPAGAVILAFPEVSRRLGRLVDAGFPLAPEAEPLALPSPWAGRGEEVAAIEAAQWGGPAAAGLAEGPVAAFVDALLAGDGSGAARLRLLAGAGEAYVLVHLDDAFQLGLLRPGRMTMTRRDLAAESFSHDLAKEVRRLAQGAGAAAWAVGRAPDGGLRAHFLVDAGETATLIARMLPFDTGALDAVPGMRLVWSAEGYWLYRLEDAAGAAPAP